MATEAVSVRLKVKSEKIREQLEEAILPLEGFHFQKPGEFGACDVLILEIGDDPEKEFQFAEAVQTSGIARSLFLTSSLTDQETLMQALKVGAKGFFSQPIDREEVRGLLLNFRSQQESQPPTKGAVKKGKIINVFGGKGGVGTTTVAVNLATSLIELEGIQTVALVDINPPFGDLPLFLNIEPPIFDWSEVAKNVTRLDSTYLMSILYKHTSGVYVLPSPPFLPDDPSIPKVMETLLRLMQTMFDFIVVDSGRTLDETSGIVLKMSDKVIVVTILSLLSLVNVKRLQSIFRKVGYPDEQRVEIVANRFNQKSTISLEEAEETLNKKILWGIPNDYRITMSAINQGMPLNSMAYSAETSSKLRGLASVIGGRKEKKQKKMFFGFRRPI